MIKFLLTLAAINIFFATPVLAATSQPTSTISVTPKIIQSPEDAKSQQIESLKERLATKAAQLRQIQRRAIVGMVKSTSVSTVSVETLTKEIKIELTDEIKVIQYLKGKRTILTTDDISKDDWVVVFGEYDVTLDILKAKVIVIFTPSKFIRRSGVISDIDKTTFTISLTSPENLPLAVDFEKSTQTQVWDKSKGLVKGGFSKLSIGDTIHVVGLEAKSGNISASRIINLGNLTGAATPTTIPSPTPTLTPTAKISPTPSKKPTSTPTPKATPKTSPTP